VTGIGAVCALIIPSVLLWKLLSAIIYRVTKRDDNEGWVGTAFVVVVAIIAISLGAMHPSITGTGDQPTGEWSYWAALYCLVAGAVVFLWQTVNFIQSFLGKVISALRGGKA
jgi:protein-S-isoprenylcysteine O-methyltransferase Ste14